MIIKDECENRVLYRLNSRNLTIGVFNKLTGGFIGLRRKFSSIFAFEEYHWDNGPPYGTVKPYERLEKLPDEIVLNINLGTSCSNCNKVCDYILFPDGPRKKRYSDGVESEIRGEWKHTEPSDCNNVYATNIVNKPLEKWLAEMELKYVKQDIND